MSLSSVAPPPEAWVTHTKSHGEACSRTRTAGETTAVRVPRSEVRQCSVAVQSGAALDGARPSVDIARRQAFSGYPPSREG